MAAAAMASLAGLGLACRDPAARGSGPAAPRAAAPEYPADHSLPAETTEESVPPGESSLGLRDTGIFSDLDGDVQLSPPDGAPERIRATLDREHAILVIYVDGWPVKAYPTGSGIALRRGDHTLQLRPGDHRELDALLTDENIAPSPAPTGSGDLDGDGIPDRLDLLIGARKTVLNGAAYGAGYMTLAYPGGDVPREVGVCTDVVIRAARNAGLDLQVALHEDFLRNRRAYPMISLENGNPSIDHRRVKTLLPYFQRHWDARDPAIDADDDPLRPGDVVFLDTFPDRSGPDHIGIVSDRIADSGRPLVINNWTDGTTTTEMDLLGFVPVTHRYRLPAGS